MTYRSDHDAALARVDALELDNARLAAENAKLREPSVRHEYREPAEGLPASGTRTAITVFCVGSVLAAALIAGAITSVDEHREHAIQRLDVRATGIAHDRLVQCAHAIAPKPHLDATVTDPHAARPLKIDPVAATGAACRDEMRVYLDSAVIDSHERRALEGWHDAEDELAGAISRLVVYYGNDPYMLDGYSTARQVWLEYDRAVSARDAALASWSGSH